jgi:plastocyanin domain-containing protein
LELTPVTKGVRHFATGSVDWDFRPIPRVKISRSAAKKLDISHGQKLSCSHILKVSVDLGSKDKAAEALKTPSTIEWAKARVVDGVKGYNGMIDVEYHDGKPYVWGGCDKDKQCVGSIDQ